MTEFRVIYLVSRTEMGRLAPPIGPEMYDRLSSQKFDNFTDAFKYADEMAEGRKARVFMSINPTDIWGDVAK